MKDGSKGKLLYNFNWIYAYYDDYYEDYYDDLFIPTSGRLPHLAYTISHSIMAQKAASTLMH
jgi:hypothetical protein